MTCKAYTLTPFGYLMVEETDGAITAMHLYAEEEPPMEAYQKTMPETELLRCAVSQMLEYFNGERKSFDFPLAPKGTPFQKKVWKALQAIPYGETATYKDIAEAVGCPRGFRAVGMANNRNPIPFVIPCHRVVGSNGTLVGYAMGLSLKQKLLDMERAATK
ncbi:MAG: methylated-DNA--[protein]-cysteine S-methyltransferase [Firmicutes bacterium]|nr:methylated-DNA--[protein]-cysteine S-methyltransferase [Bacillota bacterium]